ncbi:uncharacterized protein LOC141713366 isoform X2 [Apium graveolens]|uniref:uncharacterized protein LOC141713366 isoform X2 n=1 Tax=Apium graveolens TaxID=4045 RepID=UPI003D7A7159
MRVSKLAPRGRNDYPNSSTSGTSETESAARCSLVESSKNTKKGIEPRFYELMGPTHHSLNAIDCLTDCQLPRRCVLYINQTSIPSEGNRK